jgi:hypothetical protein
MLFLSSPFNLKPGEIFVSTFTKSHKSTDLSVTIRVLCSDLKKWGPFKGVGRPPGILRMLSHFHGLKYN